MTGVGERTATLLPWAAARPHLLKAGDIFIHRPGVGRECDEGRTRSSTAGGRASVALSSHGASNSPRKPS